MHGWGKYTWADDAVARLVEYRHGEDTGKSEAMASGEKWDKASAVRKSGGRRASEGQDIAAEGGEN
jgi:hypothetical protein